LNDTHSPQALAGVTILDFSHLLQGPFATQLLADMGANVIKVERAGAGDMFRSMTFFAKWVGGSESPNFLAWNRNKRSIALNLKSSRVHALVMDMAKRADVVVQNFRPGVLAKLGYGYDDFKAVNPRTKLAVPATGLGAAPATISADEDPRPGGRASSDYRTDSVQGGVETGFCHAGTEPVARFHILWRIGRSVYPGLVATKLCKTPQVRDKPFAVDARHG
jgi:hypothetical protein